MVTRGEQFQDPNYKLLLLLFLLMGNLPSQVQVSGVSFGRFLIFQASIFLVFAVVGLIMAGQSGAAAGGFTWLLLACYFLPLSIAIARRHASKWAIGALNLFLGWTLLGWVAAIVWSLAHTPSIG